MIILHPIIIYIWPSSACLGVKQVIFKTHMCMHIYALNDSSPASGDDTIMQCAYLYQSHCSISGITYTETMLAIYASDINLGLLGYGSMYPSGFCRLANKQ